MIRSRHQWTRKTGLALAVAVVSFQSDHPTSLTHRSQMSPTMLSTIDEFFKKHDSLVVEGQYEELVGLYTNNFSSADLAVASPDEMRRMWETLKLRYSNVQLRTEYKRIDQLGEYFMVSGCRPFRGRAAFGDGMVQDDLCASILLKDTAEDGLKIQSVFEIDHEKFARFIDDEHLYRSAEHFFEVEYPRHYLPIPHRNVGAFLDSLLLVNPHDGAWVSLELFEPTVSLAPLVLLEREFGPDFEPRSVWALSPQMVDDFSMEAAFAEVTYPKANFGEELTTDFTIAKLYLAADRHMMFALTYKCPDSNPGAARRALTEFAHGLRLATGDAEKSIKQQLLAAHPEWQTVSGQEYQHPFASLRCEIPKGLIAEPLTGNRVHRLRMQLRDDPNSHLILRVSDTEISDVRGAVETALLRTRRLFCNPTDEFANPSWTEIDFLGQTADLVTMQIDCADGSQRWHRIAIANRFGFGVMVQIIPGSDNHDLQNRQFESFLDSLRWGSD